MSFVFEESLLMGGARGKDERYLRLARHILILSTKPKGPTARKTKRKRLATDRKRL